MTRIYDIGSDGRALIIESDQAMDFVIPLYQNAAAEAVSGAGAVAVTCYYSAMTSTSTDAWTLADGLVNGQMKKVQMIVDGGTSTLTLASAASASLDVISFADAGDFALLMWVDQDDDGAGYWRILELGNDADGATAPAAA
jgi:hypothetical protein